ncbi:uncharacterized protein N7483_010157 [Penicillium malachiteum]|uniref:uncharacterized protein n=1 Tax=Penicillium malachiteum TaxID=1324776 RepID=UPI0025476800|nr:uncharacterized protein N7483_010157 [Penicillium malachiteum]KAJ5712976.1 hypothetical protein N7483_010157 [Penicillium malachiteum]
MAEIDLSGLFKDITPNQAKALRILDEGLHSSHDKAAAAAKLTDDLRLYFESANPECTDDSDYFDSPWTMLLAVVHELPSFEHPWLDVFAAVIHGLRRQGGPVTMFQNVWIAAEWLIRCGTLLYRELCTGADLTAEEQAKSNFKPGPLAEGVLPISLERWNFWRSRLLELSRAKPSVGNDEDFTLVDSVLSDITLAHIKKAISAIDSVNRWGITRWVLTWFGSAA